MKSTLAILLTTALSTAPSFAALYNVDWGKNNAPVTIGLYSGAAAVGSSGDTWNTTDPEVSGPLVDIFDSSGAPTTVDVSWINLSSSWTETDINYSTSGPGGTDLNPLMRDYGFTFPSQTATVTIAQLPLNVDYTIYLSGHPNGASQDVTFAVTGAAESAQTLSGNVKLDNDGYAAGVDYTVFNGNTGALGQIVYTQTSLTGNFSGSAGFQLDVVPEPSVALLGGLGLLGLLRRRR